MLDLRDNKYTKKDQKDQKEEYEKKDDKDYYKKLFESHLEKKDTKKY
jgi:hypothetical protein